MPDLPPANDDLTKVVPPGLLRRIKAHFTESIAEAIQGFRFNEVDEDSLTGALGQALSTPEHVVTVANGASYSFGIESYKILGKGPGTPEHRVGADGISQVSVRSNGRLIFEKGLPFQAKKLSRYRVADVIPQANDMLRTSGSGIVLRFGPHEYDAADARHLVVPSNVSTSIPTPPGFAALDTVLGDWFLKCQVGKTGLTFHRDELDPNVEGKRGFWVIDTKIRKAVDQQLNL